METKPDIRTDFLFPKRTIYTGLTSVFGIPGNTVDFNYSESGEEADRRAIASDWEMVGKDIKKALAKLLSQ